MRSAWLALAALAACGKSASRDASARDAAVAPPPAIPVAKRIGLVEKRALAARVVNRSFALTRFPHVDETTMLHGTEIPDDHLANVPGAAAVGVLVIDRGDGTPSVHCSAFAIAPDIVLTAAHCLDRRGCKGEENPAAGAVYHFVQTDNQLAQYASAPALGALACPPAFDPDECAHDVALAKLTPAVPAARTATFPLRDASSGSLTKLGYGYFLGEDMTGGDFEPGRRATATFQITSLGAATYKYSGVSPSGTTLEICAGDSGGPGLQTAADGSVGLVGVTSMYETDGSQCGEIATDARVDAEWIAKTVAALGHGGAIDKCQ